MRSMLVELQIFRQMSTKVIRLGTKIDKCCVQQGISIWRSDQSYILTLFDWRQGPYIQNTRTHLQKIVGDDNVLLVKFMGQSSESVTDFLPYHKVAEDGIILGLRRYRFFGKFSSYNILNFSLLTRLPYRGVCILYRRFLPSVVCH